MNFACLDIVLHYNNELNFTDKLSSKHGRKAIFAVNRSVKALYLKSATMLSLFYCYIDSILFYASDAWRSHKEDNIQCKHLDFSKNNCWVLKKNL